MLNVPQSIDLPIQTDENGVVRVSGTRVTLHTLITAYNNGYTPNDIHDAFSTVPLPDIYAIISYYLANQAAVDAHIRQVDEAGDRLREMWEERNPPTTKAELQARLSIHPGAT